MKLFLLFILSSCVMSYQYKTKNIKKNFNKYTKQSAKNIKQIENDLEKQKQILKELEEYKEETKIITDLRSLRKECVEKFTDLKNQDQKLKKMYLALRLEGKYIDSKKNESEFKAVEKLRKYTDSHNEIMKEKNQYYKNARNDFYQYLHKKNYKYVQTKSLKQQFLAFENKFKKNYKKASSKISELKSKLNKYGHKNKEKVLDKTSKIENILNELKTQKEMVTIIVKDYLNAFAAVDKILHGPKSPTYDSLSKLEKETKFLNLKVGEFNKMSNEIRELVN